MNKRSKSSYTNELKFEEVDVTGEETLNIISQSNRFNEWMYNTIKPFSKGKVLEIGSGTGNISNHFLRDKFEIKLTDIRKKYCERLKDQFKNFKSFQGAEVMNLTDPDFGTKFKNHLNQYDTVFALNVVEHIYDDKLAIHNCKKLLKKNGHLIILVPSYKLLYNGFDKELGHYRRYTLKSLKKLFKDNEMQIMHQQYFNFIGIMGWFVSGRLLKNKNIPAGQMNIYNKFIPLIKFIDKLLFNKIGLSTIIVGKNS